MSTNELLRNGSGYVDPTAYKALTAVAKTQQGVAVKPGSVWSAYFGTTSRKCVVMTAHKDHATILVLNDEPKGYGCELLETVAGTTYYAIPALLSYKYYEDFDVQKDSLDPAEFSRMWDLTLNYLGVPRAEAPVYKPAKDDPDVVALRDELVKTQTELRSAETRCIELAVARDLYREEYRELQARLIGKV